MYSQLEINFWNNMSIKHNESYKNWCPQSIKDIINEEVEEINDDCFMCFKPKCECEKYYLCNKCNGPFACDLDVDEIICAGEQDNCSSCYGINCYTCNEYKYWENFEKDLTEVKHEVKTEVSNFKSNVDKCIIDLNKNSLIYVRDIIKQQKIRKELCLMVVNKLKIKNRFTREEDRFSKIIKQTKRDRGANAIHSFENVFGIIDYNCDTGETDFRFNTRIGKVRRENIKNGIEILNMRIRKVNNKYNYGTYEEQDENNIKRHTIKNLKEFCKMNGIKFYSKCDKNTLVKLLMEL